MKENEINSGGNMKIIDTNPNTSEHTPMCSCDFCMEMKRVLFKDTPDSFFDELKINNPALYEVLKSDGFIKGVETMMEVKSAEMNRLYERVREEFEIVYVLGLGLWPAETKTCDFKSAMVNVDNLINQVRAEKDSEAHKLVAERDAEIKRARIAEQGLKDRGEEILKLREEIESLKGSAERAIQNCIVLTRAVGKTSERLGKS